MQTLKSFINLAFPGVIADVFRLLKLGDILVGLPTFLRAKDPVAASTVDAGAHVVVLPDDAKAASLFFAYARAGSGTQGPLALAAAYPPSAGEYGITPAGDIAFAAADAWSSVDVGYLPDSYDIVEMTTSVTPGTGVCALPVSLPSIVMLLSAEALLGTTTGAKIVDAPGTASATGHARLDVAKGQVLFATADAVTSGKIKLAVKKATDVPALLEAASPFSS